ncbi:2-hydroxyacid dehydrogenase [Arenibacter latericius]|uniref:2-hydroxyacid dehydrogenase n=1 Tax=Arenibacter latericius TaxID=86104 RepID=UPI00042744BE|nr:2-hydroxyacid dehydrogenase [Arenibacter latericius]
MKLLVYSAKEFEIPFLEKANNGKYQVTYYKEALDTHTAIKAIGYNSISIFSGDDPSLIVLEELWDLGVRNITLRSTGHNNIQIHTAKRFGFKVANVPNYSPYAIAEHATSLLLTLNRKVILANLRAKNYNFIQNDLLGFDLNGKTVGIIGTGNVGAIMVKIMHGFGCHILTHDIKPNLDLVSKYGTRYVGLQELYSKSDIISLHVPLTQETHYLLDDSAFKIMKNNVILINTARGAVVDTSALLTALGNHLIGAYGTDVYEHEKGTFFRDNSKTGIKDDQLKKLLSFSNVLLTPHQGFITSEALTNIAESTFYNLDCWAEGVTGKNELGWQINTL